MKVVCIVQARLGSTRFPNKVLKKIGNKTIIEILLSRIKKSKYLDQIVLATSNTSLDIKLANFITRLGFEVFKGSHKNVLKRYYLAAKKYEADIIVRITGDCPLVDSNLIDQMIKKFKEKNYDYISNTLIPTYPDGLDIEVFSFNALNKTFLNSKTQIQKEHVTPYMYQSGKLKILNQKNRIDYSKFRLTIDEIRDYQVLKKIFKYFKPNIFFPWTDVMSLTKLKPNIFKMNEHIKRNQGMEISEGQKLWNRAKKSIPGGNMLLSKKAELFAPKIWPSYYSKSKGCYVWTLENKKLVDFSLMGVGTNILGYANSEIDKAVNKTIRNGNMTTLNCPEEVYLAEKLIEMHPWSSMVRFARTGGEANSIALRIARAATGKDKVAICGYHGWHDWYLSTNLKNDKNLKDFLLPGLEPKGVPKSLKNSTYTFLYNRIDQLEKLIKNNSDIGVIFMEVSRNEKPKNNFLHKVRKLATKNNIVLIFDECSSGFRENFGGLHLKYKVNPDIVMLGKALGNGYAITAVVGKKEIMKEAENSFISSTFWTERIGPTAALKCLEIMQKEKSWEYVTNYGKKVINVWKKLASNYNLKIKIAGLPALASFIIVSDNFLKYKTFITQQMLNKNYLASNILYASISHDQKLLNNYAENLDKIFAIISKCEKGEDLIDNYLKGPVCYTGFKRLN